MALFTVLVEFEDRTIAIEHIKASTAPAALEAALRSSEALSTLDRAAISELIANRLRINQVAALRGVWTWHQVPEEGSSAPEVFGGAIIQSDENAPARDESPNLV